ncbi:MAG: thiosulfate oxidation carrier protein SoxY, partial [Burkholderiaceae bacterium]
MIATRRQVLQTTLGTLLLPLGARLVRAQTPSPSSTWNKAAFEAKTVDAALKALGLPRAAESKELQVMADELSENGA